MLPERRHEVSRLEAFSDAAFAFALTLLVVSLDVPRSYDELMRTMRGFPSFACCFALLVWIWHEHNIFFRRYGLQDAWTVFINSMLLFVTLFYVYPLKFMFDSMFAQFMPAAYPELQRMTLARALAGLGDLRPGVRRALQPVRPALPPRLHQAGRARADAARGVRRQVVRRPSPRQRVGRARRDGRGRRRPAGARPAVADLLRADGTRRTGGSATASRSGDGHVRSHAAQR